MTSSACAHLRCARNIIISAGVHHARTQAQVARVSPHEIFFPVFNFPGATSVNFSFRSSTNPRDEWGLSEQVRCGPALFLLLLAAVVYCFVCGLACASPYCVAIDTCRRARNIINMC